MLYLNQDANKHCFQVKDDTENIIAEGYYDVDQVDRSALALVTKTTLTPNNHEQIDQLLSIIENDIGQSNHARVFTWFPMFDGQFDISQQKVNHKGDCLMLIDTKYVKYDASIDINQEQYELITNKNVIETYFRTLKDMMCTNAFWAKDWSEQEAKERVRSASGVVLIIDRSNNDPCAFGRIFTVTSDQGQNEKFAYLTDIAVSSQHQNKRLGLVVTNTLLKMFIDGHDTENVRGTICLCCADQGVGAIAAPRLYKKFGFDYSKQMQDRPALVHTDQFYKRVSL